MKRIISLLLVLLLFVFSAVPVSALEAGSSLSLESEEDTFAFLIPTSEVQARLAGGTDYLDKFGVTRAEVIQELSAHEHDDYYLNTPFASGDWQSPRGDTSYNGAPGTNCAGFVAYVLRKCGLDTAAVYRTMRSGRFTNWGSGRPYDGLSSASNYMSLAEKGKIKAYAYPSKAALLAGGQCEKGDLILRFWTDSWGGYDEDNHLMIFWGSTPTEDKVWQNASGRLHIGPMWSGNASSYIVIKFAPLKQPVPTVAGFEDVTKDRWYAEDVAFVKERGLMGGTEAGKFSPDGTVTRGQLVTILWRLSGKPEAPTASGFTDVNPEEYYASAVDWAASKEIVNGYDGKTFAPKSPVTRQELAVILYRYCLFRGCDTTAIGALEPFEDADELGRYAVTPMQWAIGKELIRGTGAALKPLADTPRCQLAAILARMCRQVLGEGETK